jgi:hypothetical protein
MFSIPSHHKNVSNGSMDENRFDNGFLICGKKRAISAENGSFPQNASTPP